MKTLLGFHKRPNLLSQLHLFLCGTTNPNPGYRRCNQSARLFSDQSRLSVADQPLTQHHTLYLPTPKSHQNPIPKTVSNSEPNDFATICKILRSPSVSPGPPLEAALDDTGIELGQALLQQAFDNFSSSPELLLSVFRWAERQKGYVSSAAIFNAMVKVLARARVFHSAWSLILDRLKQPLLEGPDMNTFAILIRRYARSGMPSPAIRTFEFASSLDLTHNSSPELNLFDVLLDSFCNEGLVREASKYLEKRRGKDPSWVPSLHIYNLLLNGWLRSRRYEQMERLWYEMRKENVKPNIATYGTLVKGYCQMCRIEAAMGLVDEMRREGIGPNAVVYNSIIDALVEEGKLSEALDILERFLVLESGPTISTYNSLVRGFCKEDDLDEANKVLKMMISRGFMPTVTTYSYYFRNFLKFERLEEAMNLYTKMMESGYALDSIAYHLLFKLLCNQECLGLAMQIKKDMIASGYNLDLSASSKLVYLFCKMHRFDEAFRELEDMKQRGMFPLQARMQRMIDELKIQGMYEMASKLNCIISVPHSVKLSDASALHGDASRARTFIIQKAKAVSDTLKTCRDPRELVKRRGSSENAVSGVLAAKKLIEDIKRRV